jgi:Ni,Fe-hydrogenase III component G
MAILDTITHSDVAKRHRPWPRALVSEEGWRQAIDQLATGRLVLLGLWGDAPMVHMALFDESSGDAAVTSYSCKNDEYPSVGARHAPAIRLERAIYDLFGLEAVDAPDMRSWLDLGFWDVRHPLGK